MYHWLKAGILCLPFLISSSLFAFDNEDLEELEILFVQDVRAYVAKVSELIAIEDTITGRERFEYLFHKGRAQQIQGVHQLAIINFETVLEESIDIELNYKALRNLVVAKNSVGEFEEAFSYGLMLQDKVYEDIGEGEKVAGLLNLALVLNQSGLVDEAGKVLDSFDWRNSVPRNRCYAATLFADAALRYDKRDMPYDELFEHGKWCNENGQILFGYLIEFRLMGALINDDKLDTPLELLKQKEIEVIDFGYDSLTVAWLALLSEAYARTEDIDNAVEYANRAADYQLILNDVVTRLIVLEALTLTYSLVGDFEKAFEYSQLHHETYSTSLEQQLTASLAYNAASMRAAQREQQIALLSKENELLEKDTALAKAQAANARFYFFIPVLIVLVLVAILGRLTVSRKNLRKRVVYDKLTRIFSRDYFEELTASTLRHAKAHDEEVGFIMFDLDKFKIINDTHGHGAGDWVLQKAAHVAKQVLRKNDTFGRVGGEEFAIILPKCDLQTSLRIAEKIRLELENIETEDSGAMFDVTASFGVTSSRISGFDVNDLKADADAALYVAKNEGRNTVVAARKMSDALENKE